MTDFEIEGHDDQVPVMPSGLDADRPHLDALDVPYGSRQCSDAIAAPVGLLIRLSGPRPPPISLEKVKRARQVLNKIQALR
jgi:hypothetical protein